MDGYRADADGGDAAATAAASVDRGGGRKPGILIWFPTYVQHEKATSGQQIPLHCEHAKGATLFIS